MLYFDNAATTFPKPPQVYDAVNDYMRTIGVGAGRSAHDHALGAGRIMFDARERCAALFNVRDAARIIFTMNATSALNLAILGSVRTGDRVVVSSMEHNSVMRPLRFLQNGRRVIVEMVANDGCGGFDLSAWEKALQKRPQTVVVNHGSNIIGTIAPLAEIGALCRKYGVRFIVDAAQTAGLVPIDVEEAGIDCLCFSGHKNLFGIQGTGGLYIREGFNPDPLVYGGTGSRSESDEQPLFLPDRFESGTQNMPGIASLASGAEFVAETGISTIFNHGVKISRIILDGLRSNGRIRVYGPQTPEMLLPTISITMNGLDNGFVAGRLNDYFGIAIRVGLHCAPEAHRTIGTFPAGTIRISAGYFTTEDNCMELLAALKKIGEQG